MQRWLVTPFLFAFLPPRPGKKAAGGEEAASANQRKPARAASDLVGNRGDLAGEDFGAGVGDLRREPWGDGGGEGRGRLGLTILCSAVRFCFLLVPDEDGERRGAGADGEASAGNSAEQVAR